MHQRRSSPRAHSPGGWILGLPSTGGASNISARVGSLARGFPHAHWPAIAIGAWTLAVLLLLPRFEKRVPVPLAALASARCWPGSRAAWCRASRWTPSARASEGPIQNID